MQAFAVTPRYLKTRATPDSVDSLAALAGAVKTSPLTSEETTFARTAWAYFKQHTNRASGFCPATDKGTQISPWEMGATLIAITCASRLRLISKRDAHARLTTCLGTIAALPLNRHHLPVHGYHHATLQPALASSHSSSKPGTAPVRQVMRLVSGLVITAHHTPDLAPEASMILNRWSLDHLIAAGRFRPLSGYRSDQSAEYLGYEQYAARIACLVGLSAQTALDLRPILSGHQHGDMLLPGDKRRGGLWPPIITSDPFHLEAMEFGWRQDMLEIAASLFLAQKTRFEQTGHLTALTEITLDQPPGAAIQGILTGDQPFASCSPEGQDLAHLRCLATKAAFGWQALLPSPYAQKLLDAVSGSETGAGWQSGIYEKGGTRNTAIDLNTNAMILEALHYRGHGPLFAL